MMTGAKKGGKEKWLGYKTPPKHTVGVICVDFTWLERHFRHSNNGTDFRTVHRLRLPRQGATYATNSTKGVATRSHLGGGPPAYTGSGDGAIAATRSVGRSDMNPTVSDRMISRPEASRTFRMVGSRVANNMSRANTSARVKRLNKVDLPAFV